jgi:hypothetical protein
MILPQPVVLISPLLALLRDQHEKLLKRRIPCVRLDGTVRGKARREALEQIARGGSLLVMTTPETLGSEEGQAALRQSGVSLAAIDEAHCISEWGHDFRPAYLQIGERLRAAGRPPIMALTATATAHVREDIVRFLGLREPVVVAGSPHRANLAFEVLHSRGDARLRALIRFARRLRRPGIIYCTTTREVDNVFTALQMLRIPAHRYHGKMASNDRNHQQEMYMKAGRRTVMVATSAFGLGIDKPDIRYIVHYQSPASLEQYVQEEARRTRRQKANCILLYDETIAPFTKPCCRRAACADQLYKLGARWRRGRRRPYAESGRWRCRPEQGPRITAALLAVLEGRAVSCRRTTDRDPRAGGVGRDVRAAWRAVRDPTRRTAVAWTRSPVRAPMSVAPSTCGATSAKTTARRAACATRAAAAPSARRASGSRSPSPSARRRSAGAHAGVARRKAAVEVLTAPLERGRRRRCSR